MASEQEYAELIIQKAGKMWCEGIGITTERVTESYFISQEGLGALDTLAKENGDAAKAVIRHFPETHGLRLSLIQNCWRQHGSKTKKSA